MRREQDADSTHDRDGEASLDSIFRRHSQAQQMQVQLKLLRRKGRRSKKTLSLVELQKLQRFYTQKMAHSQQKQRSEVELTNDVLSERERANAEK